MNKRLLFILTAVALFSGRSLGMAQKEGQAGRTGSASAPTKMVEVPAAHMTVRMSDLAALAKRHGVHANLVVPSATLTPEAIAAGKVAVMAVRETSAPVDELELADGLAAVNSAYVDGMKTALKSGEIVALTVKFGDEQAVAHRLRLAGLKVEVK